MLLLLILPFALGDTPTSHGWFDRSLYSPRFYPSPQHPLIPLPNLTNPILASFATLIDNPTTTALTRAEFDPTNQYAPVFDAVQQAAGSGAEIKIFRAEMDAGGRRAEYFVVGWDGEGGKVVGLRAVGVET
ncbi:hypothetical protein P152DRAFT_462413 [Eremomyces bilateralis CBS 781.70]|uniref:Uncharacterized protein n=1 Tax=Eremomyces bilateralis CBS 781.70 TaxID=1392243 RepID=A0A6G1FRY6_9PEZI|nr:uncharacterized protein P152DRAFT_462413 [Eremomyces bilateralis CBS 781.70]KAF1808543.1 hypothetical protein P152DRAFT_462413 [Eremomyces bilateralis CBS 781.70]